MITRFLAVVLTCLFPAMLAAESKLIRVGQGGAVDRADLPTCESVRNWGYVPARSREKVRRFWDTIRRSHSEDYRRRMDSYSKASARIRESFAANYEESMTSLVRDRRDQGARGRVVYDEVEALRRELGRREAQEQARLREEVGTEQQRADAAFSAAKNALLASLPPADRRGAEQVMVPVAPSAGTCR